MPHFSTTRRVSHSAADMFNLVADVEKYPQFVPMCTATHVRQRSDNDKGVTVLTASMTVAYMMIHQTFTSRATLDRLDHKILVEYLDGPFKRMQNRWSFHDAGPKSCDVKFFIDYEFRSRALAMLMGALFDTAFRRMAAAFERRADEIYGCKRS